MEKAQLEKLIATVEKNVKYQNTAWGEVVTIARSYEMLRTTGSYVPIGTDSIIKLSPTDMEENLEMLKRQMFTAITQAVLEDTLLGQQIGPNK